LLIKYTKVISYAQPNFIYHTCGESLINCFNCSE